MTQQILSPDEEAYGPSRTLIIGEPGVGKTQMAALFPNPLFIETEKGAGSVKAWRLNVDPDERCLGDVRDIFKNVKSAEKVKTSVPGEDHILYDFGAKGKQKIQAAVLDTFDTVQFTQKRKLLGSRTKMEWEDWGNLLELCAPLLEDIGVCPIHVVVTAHAKDEAPYRDQKTNKWMPGSLGLDLQGAIAAKLPSWFDYILFLAAGDDGDRYVIWQPGVYKHHEQPYKYLAKDRHHTFDSLKTNGAPFSAYPWDKATDKPSRKFVDLILAKHKINFVEDQLGTMPATAGGRPMFRS